MAEEQEPTKQTEPSGTSQPEGSKQEGTPQSANGSGEPEGMLDSHGQKAVALGKYQRDMKAKDDEISKLKKQLEDAAGKADEGSKAMDEVNKLRQELKDRDLDMSLASLGCVDAKAARARLDDFGGDLEKLRESCPYLFRTSGTSGVMPSGSGNQTAEDRRRRARAAAGLKD